MKLYEIGLVFSVEMHLSSLNFSRAKVHSFDVNVEGGGTAFLSVNNVSLIKRKINSLKYKTKRCKVV